MLRHHFLLFAILTLCTWHSTEQLRLKFQRTVNFITLFCLDQADQKIDLMTNPPNVTLYINRPGLSSTNELRSLAHLTYSDSGTGASFIITHSLEGYYWCGVVSSSEPMVISQRKPLIALPSTDGFPTNDDAIYAVQSSDGEVTVPCPFEPGNLQNCYFGQWTKDNVEIAKIGNPDGSCTNAGKFMTVDMSKYGINRKRFSLSITSVTAQEDSGQYQCRLQVVNPATSNGQTADFRSIPVTLIVDGQPMITKPPMDVVIGLEQEEKRLTETATFECVALGRPTPDINWYYIIVNQDGSLGKPEHLMNDERYSIVNDDGDEDPTGRFNSTSTLTMSVIESDGGIIRCQAGTNFADARLTVLGKPSIDIIATLRGEMLIYDIGVKVRFNRPVMLNISYQDVNSGEQLSRDSQPVESYNDTSEITFRETMRDLPTGCSKCRVIVSLTARMGNQIMQGPSVTSSDVIDRGAITPQEAIYSLAASIAIAFLIFVVIIVAVTCYCQKKQLKLKQKNKDDITCEKITYIKDKVEEQDCSDKERILAKLKELEEFVRTAPDSSSDDTEQSDLAHIEQTLGNLLSVVKKN